MRKPYTPSKKRKFRLSKSALLDLYDQRSPADEDTGSPITSITSLIGEDLVLGLLALFFEENGDPLLKAPKFKCKGDGQRGPQLDAWLITKYSIFQTEVKNWCASAIGGVGINDESHPLQQRKGRGRNCCTWLEAAIHNRDRYLRHPDVAKKVWKVLAKMTLPSDFPRKKPKPLLAFWSPIAGLNAKGSKDLVPFFKLPTSDFEEVIASTGLELPKPCARYVWVFSASNYLRTKKNQEYFDIWMPRVHARLIKLRDLGFPIGL